MILHLIPGLFTEASCVTSKKHMSLRRINHHRRAEPQKDVKEAELVDKPGKAERGEKKTERECISMKKKLPEKKAEVAKNEANRERPVPIKTKETALR